MDSRRKGRYESSDDELEVESNNNGGDIISGLCDAILHHIFSFLPTKDVVQTCVLSKRWRNLWCSVPWLDFDEDAFLAGSFSTFVNHAMLLRDGSNIQKLRLSCSSNNVFEYIVSAIKHNLQVLDLKIVQHHQAENVLPPPLFTCASLTSLILNNVVLPGDSSNMCLSSLKTMHLISVKFPSNQSTTTESLFSNSPILENLFIHNCNFQHLKNFQISASQLKNLIIIQDVVAPSSIGSIPLLTKISAPNLISLRLHGDMQSTWYVLKNLNSLVEANIHIKKPLSKRSSLIFMIGVLCQLKNAKAITLSGSCLQVMSKGSWVVGIPKELNTSVGSKGTPIHNLRPRIMKIIGTPFRNLKLLNLKTWFEDGEVHAITDLLKLSPNIETLVIEYNSESSYEGNKIPGGEEKLPSKCTLHHLKTIQMRGFGGRKNEVKLLTFLLENAKSLKKMIVEEASI